MPPRHGNRPVDDRTSPEARALGMDRRAVEGMRLRIGLVVALFLLAFAGLAARAVDLQVLDRERLTDFAENQALRELVHTPRRGRIIDRNGESLAASAEVASVYADPARVSDPAGTASALARTLKVDRATLERRLRSPRRFVWVARRVAPELATAVEGLKLAGVHLTQEARRFYPQKELAAQVVGFTGIDGQGLEGLELVLDHALRGTPRQASALRDARGGWLVEPGQLDPEHLEGGTVILTLDRTLQWITEKALDLAVREAKAKAGTAVVLDPHTGEILAMASRPTFNPNDPGESKVASRRNRVVTDLYEPGSTFKALTVAAALEDGAVQVGDRFDCGGGSDRIGGHVIHDSHAHDILSLTEVLQVSSNVGAAKVAERMGKQALVDAMHRFGIGTVTGVGLPGEQAGVLRPADRLSDVGLATLSFGQGVSTTPLQVATAVAALANGGRLMRPYVVREVRDETDTVLERHEPTPVRQVVSAETARAVTRMLTEVVEAGGTGTRAAVPGYRVAGKTGTSQKVDPVTRGYSKDKRVGSFVGYLPAEDPRVVILVTIDEPEGVKYGGVVAAPAFRAIAEGAMRYLGVPPTEPLSEAPLVAAAAPLDEAEGEVLPAALVPPPEGKTLVPDLTGLDLRTAVGRLTDRHLEARPRGTGLVARQDPPPGEIVGPGDSVSLTLSPTG